MDDPCVKISSIYFPILGEQGIELSCGSSRVTSATSSAASRPNSGDKLEKLILSEAKAILREGGNNSAKSSPTKEDVNAKNNNNNNSSRQVSIPQANFSSSWSKNNTISQRKHSLSS